MAIVTQGSTTLNAGAKGDKGDTGSTGADGVDGQDGVGGIALDIQTEVALKFKEGYRTANYFNYLDLQDGYIANNTTAEITPPITNEKVSGKVYLETGWYGFYNITTTTWLYCQIFDLNDTYQSSIQLNGVNLNFGFEIPVDGYIIFDVNRRPTTALDEIVVSDYNPLFTAASNNLQYYSFKAPYRPYLNDDTDIVYELTDNLINVDNMQPYVGGEANISAFIRVEGLLGGEVVSIWDDIKPLYDPSKKLIVEYNISDVEIASYTTPLTGQNYKQHTLNAATTYFDILIWDLSSSLWGDAGTITPDKLEEGFRVNIGEYFTQESRSYKIKSINNIHTKEVVNSLKGKKIVSFGDSLTEPKTLPLISYMDVFRFHNEMILRNYALGFGKLLNQVGTTDQDDWISATINDQNTVANQVLRFITDSTNTGFIPDVAILTGGTNDVNGTIYEGNLVTATTNYLTPSSQDRKTTYGILFWAVRQLRIINPSIRIIFITPPKRVQDDATNSNMLSKFVSQYQLASETLGVELINMFYLFDSLTAIGENPNYDNSTHPNTTGKLIQGKEVLNLVKKYY